MKQMKQKHWQVSVFDKTSEIIKDDTFYTTDTKAYLVFELIDEDFEPDSAMVTVYNIYGTAIINVSVEVADGIARYEMPEKAIRHPGGWRTQAIFTKDNEDYTTRIIEFDVGGHLLDSKKPPIVEIENWNSLIEHAGELIDDWEQLEEIRQANEQQRESAELARQTTFETNESTRQSEFETNETERESTFEINESARQANELIREEAEGSRQSTFEEKEAGRQSEFEENEQARESAESVRVSNEEERELNEAERISKDSERDSKIEAVEEELNQHKLDYVEYLASELGEEHIIRSLPNGTKDEINVNTGAKTQRVKEHVLQANDIISVDTAGIYVDLIVIKKPTDYQYYNSKTKLSDGSVLFKNAAIATYSEGAGWDLPENANSITAGGSNIYFAYFAPKGIYSSQAAAQLALTGLTLTYQLAEPILIPLPEQMTPNTTEIARLSELTNKLTNAIISLGGTIV